jgi:hypothetical protein
MIHDRFILNQLLSANGGKFANFGENEDWYAKNRIIFFDS